MKKENSDSYSAIEAMLKKMALGTAVSGIVYPAIYAKNQIMSGETIIWRQCLKGIGPFAASYVPTATVAMTVNGMLLRAEATEMQMLGVAAISGAVSRPFCVMQENIAQNMGVKENKNLSAAKIMHKALVKGGIECLMRGTSATILREIVFVEGYIALMPIVKNSLGKYAPGKQWVHDLIASATIGTIVGTATTPFDLWRNQKQQDLLNREKAPSYKTIIQENRPKKIGWKNAYRGAAGRSFACSLAIYCMAQGKRYIDEQKEKEI